MVDWCCMRNEPRPPLCMHAAIRLTADCLIYSRAAAAAGGKKARPPKDSGGRCEPRLSRTAKIQSIKIKNQSESPTCLKIGPLVEADSRTRSHFLSPGSRTHSHLTFTRLAEGR